MIEDIQKKESEWKKVRELLRGKYAGKTIVRERIKGDGQKSGG